MNMYAILRRSGWRSPQDLEQAAARSTKVGDEEMSDDIRWIRSYGNRAAGPGARFGLEVVSEPRVCGRL